MTKILAIGDFHGKFQKKWTKIIKREKIDFVISNGDYPPFHYRKLWFQHCYGTDKELWEVIGKKKYRELVLEDLKRAENALSELNKVPVPAYTVLGNIDYPCPDDISDFSSSDQSSKKNNMPSYDKKDALLKRLKKYGNIKRFDYSYARFEGLILVGMRGHSAPGEVRSKSFRKHKKKLDGLFKKFSKENKEGKVIFVSHNVPYNTRLDKASMKAHKAVRGKHLGSKMARKIIDQKKPILAIGGHMHEGMGKQKIGKTLAINTGSAHEGKAAIIEISERNKVKVKFVK